ncbi:MAG TPA: formate dehydrogenase subunit delta [Gemmatimonadales bacterium]|nr:formate dehydrogenase subunit delta [Gemmatimonadales bacterium]
MDVHHLVEMANQIGQFYVAEPDQTQAQLDTASHIRRFWDPRMRAALLRHLDDHAAEGLDPFVAEALRVHRALVTPPPPSRPTASGPATKPK